MRVGTATLFSRSQKRSVFWCGAEIVDPHRNVSRTIIISIGMSAILYVLVALTVAARPAFGDFGLWSTVALAIVATMSGVFAVSRVLAMLLIFVGTKLFLRSKATEDG